MPQYAVSREDVLSDIDLQVAGDDGRVEDVFGTVENTLRTLSPIDLRYRLPEPTFQRATSSV